jgi:hypothetical protein
MQLPLPLASGEPLPRFVRHRRARRYILRVLGDGTVRVTLPRWGSKSEALQFLDANRSWIDRQRARRTVGQAPVTDEANIRRRARHELPLLLRELAARHGIAVNRVTIRNQRSRWGSCSPDRNITLNWRLMLLPDFVREYVLLHELMHCRELNHSPRFWRSVAGVCPRIVEARRWLRREGYRLL